MKALGSSKVTNTLHKISQSKIGIELPAIKFTRCKSFRFFPLLVLGEHVYMASFQTETSNNGPPINTNFYKDISNDSHTMSKVYQAQACIYSGVQGECRGGVSHKYEILPNRISRNGPNQAIS